MFVYVCKFVCPFCVCVFSLLLFIYSIFSKIERRLAEDLPPSAAKKSSISAAPHAAVFATYFILVSIDRRHLASNLEFKEKVAATSSNTFARFFFFLSDKVLNPLK